MVAREDKTWHSCGLRRGAARARPSTERASRTHFYTPGTGALLGTLLCEDFCLLCTTPFTEGLGVLIEYKKINKSLASRSKCSTFKESNHTASTVQSANMLGKNFSLTHAHSEEATLSHQETRAKVYTLFENHFGDAELTIWMLTILNGQNGMK